MGLIHYLDLINLMDFLFRSPARGATNGPCKKEKRIKRKYSTVTPKWNRSLKQTFITFYEFKNSETLTLPMLRLLSSKAQGRSFYENHLYPVMLVFIGQISVSTIK